MASSRQTVVPDQIDALSQVWEARDPAWWKSNPSRFVAFGKQAVALGRPGLAFDILNEGLAVFPGHQEMRYLSALALAKGGSAAHAMRVLRTLLPEQGIDGALYSDILSLAGRVAKDRWSKLPDGPERSVAGEQARLHYQRAFEFSSAYFPGINAATISVLLGHEADGLRLAREVRELCLDAVQRAGEVDPWLFATLGEACLLLGEWKQSIEWYGKALARVGNRHGDVASMRRQVKLLAPRFDHAAEILKILAVPRVVIFSGHMLDAPGRTAPRFPAYVEGAVMAAIAEAIADNRLGVGYCSAACGADILFIEQMLERGAEVNIVLPFERGDFIRTSVSFGGEKWVERFDAVLSQAASVCYCVEENHLGDDILFAYAGELTQGLGILRAEQLETDAIVLAVAEPEAEANTGGTASNLRRWESQGRRAVVLNLREIREGVRGRETAEISVPAPGVDGGTREDIKAKGAPWGQRQIRTMLFADMVGFSKLREHETPQFFVHFLGAIDAEVKASRNGPAFGNTWGDGLYLVFDKVEDGADFALRLRDGIARVEWGRAGLPPDMNIRIGMHTGPVFRALDPIIKQENFFGSHVTRAARIEPVAAPGSVYVSEQMAAALAASGNRNFSCDYLGPLSLAKKYGNSRIYRLRRALDIE